MSMTETTNPSLSPEFNLGHIAELNVRNTRLASDEVNTQLIPKLSARLAEGNLSVKDALSINQVYFRNPGIAGSDKNITFLVSKDEFDVQHILDAPYPRSAVGIRMTNVQNDLFCHAGSGNLEAHASELFEQLNTFVTNSANLTEREVRHQISKYYLLFSALHLPLDGSGRFSGDLDTTIQEAVKIKWEQANKTFTPQLISTNGWRAMETGDEGNMMRAERQFNRDLIEHELLPRMIKTNPQVMDNYNYGKFKFSSNPLKAKEQMQTFVKELNDDPKLRALYYSLLDAALHEIIPLDPSTEDDHWFKDSIIRTSNSRRNARVSSEYVSSENLPQEWVGKLDSLVALTASGNYGLVSEMLQDTSFIESNALDLREVPLVLKAILSEIHHTEGSQYLTIINSNPTMKRLSKSKRR